MMCSCAGVAGVLGVSSVAAAGDWRHRKTPQSSNWPPDAAHQQARWRMRVDSTMRHLTQF